MEKERVAYHTEYVWVRSENLKEKHHVQFTLLLHGVSDEHLELATVHFQTL